MHPAQDPNPTQPAVWHRPPVREAGGLLQRAAEHSSAQRATNPDAPGTVPAPGLSRPAVAAGARMGTPDPGAPAVQPAAARPAPPPLPQQQPQPPMQARPAVEPIPAASAAAAPPAAVPFRTQFRPRPDSIALRQDASEAAGSIAQPAAPQPPAPDFPQSPALARASGTPLPAASRAPVHTVPPDPAPAVAAAPAAAASAGATAAPDAPAPHLRQRAEPAAPQPGVFSATGPGDAGMRSPSPRAATGADFHAGNPQRVAALQDTPGGMSRWTRRALGWSLAFSLLAAVVAGGLWMYEDRRADGALMMIANHDAARALAAQRAASMAPSVPDKPAAITPAPVPATPAPAPSAPAASERSDPPAAAAPAVDASPPAVPSAVAQDRDAGAADTPPARHARRHARHAGKPAPVAVAPAAGQPATPSPRRRREETLMQCRAHGYDERQCMARGCEMTRFGFACHG